MASRSQRHPAAQRSGWWQRVKSTWQAKGQTASGATKNRHYDPEFLMGATTRTMVHAPGKPVWMGRDYARFSDEGYIRNVIAHRAIAMVAEAAASVPWTLYQNVDGGLSRLPQHPLLTLLNQPNPLQGGSEFFQALYTYRMIAGNAYMQAIRPQQALPTELHLLRPDRVAVIAGKSGVPSGYRYQVGDSYRDFPVDRLTGRSSILHLKIFHPLNDWYGLSPIEAAAYSIDQHNQSGAWNQALLQNGARPSGALIVKMAQEGGTGALSEEQYHRIRQQIDDQFSGPSNAGRPLLLEGGLEWREMSISPRDMDFINIKHSAARDIALAFGVPPQLLGIPGDNTYSNLAEARLALWEQTVIPMVDLVCDALNNWLVPEFGQGLQLALDTDGVSALAVRREKVWERVNGASFLTDDEKRELVGLPPIRASEHHGQ